MAGLPFKKKYIFNPEHSLYKKYVNINGYLPSKIVKIMCEALVLIKKIQEDPALGYGTRISSKNIYLHVCRGEKNPN